MTDGQMVVVHSFNSEMEAVIAKSALDAAGINAVIHAEAFCHMEPPVALATGGFQLLVPEEDAQDACEVLEPQAGGAEEEDY